MGYSKDCTFLSKFWASCSDKAKGLGEHSSLERDKAARLGIKILCSVLPKPNTLSPKLLSISSGKGSLAPKLLSPSIAKVINFVCLGGTYMILGHGFDGNEEDRCSGGAEKLGPAIVVMEAMLELEFHSAVFLSTRTTTGYMDLYL